MKCGRFLTVAKIIFETHVPIERREPVLRRLMILHRRRPDFWMSKSSGLGMTKKQRKNAPPTWNEANRLRALELWFEEYFGRVAWRELRLIVRDGKDFADFLKVERQKQIEYLRPPQRRPRGRPRGSTNILAAEIIPIFPRADTEKKAA
jgi:hypothetical protein